MNERGFLSSRLGPGFRFLSSPLLPLVLVGGWGDGGLAVSGVRGSLRTGGAGTPEPSHLLGLGRPGGVPAASQLQWPLLPGPSCSCLSAGTKIFPFKGRRWGYFGRCGGKSECLSRVQKCMVCELGRRGARSSKPVLAGLLPLGPKSGPFCTAPPPTRPPRAGVVSVPPERRPWLGPSGTRSSLKPRAAVTMELRSLLARGSYPDPCCLSLGSAGLGVALGSVLGASQEGGLASCGRRAGGQEAPGHPSLPLQLFMEQLSHARPSGRQDTEQVAWVGFPVLGAPTAWWEADGRPGEASGQGLARRCGGTWAGVHLRGPGTKSQLRPLSPAQGLVPRESSVIAGRIQG